MTQEALKLALEFIEDSECGTADLQAHIKEALAQRTWERPWVSLTDEQVKAIAEEFVVGGWICDFARAIEAELKDKNT